VIRSPIGTGLVAGVCIGETSPALLQAVATSCGWVISSFARACFEVDVKFNNITLHRRRAPG